MRGDYTALTANQRRQLHFMIDLIPLLSDMRSKQNQEMPSVALSRSLSLENLLGDLDLLSSSSAAYIDSFCCYS